MNGVERDFSLRLEALKQAGEIASWHFEGITLRMPNGLAYTPDFAVWKLDDENRLQWYLMETKGAFIRDDARTKFLAFSAYFTGNGFNFEMHQSVKKQWKQIL